METKIINGGSSSNDRAINRFCCGRIWTILFITALSILISTSIYYRNIVTKRGFNFNSHETKYVRDNHALMIPKHRKRLERVKRVCASYKQNDEYFKEYVEMPKNLDKGKFTISNKGRLVMCNTMKQGTTSWARMFLQLYLPRAVNWKRVSAKYSPFDVGYQVKLKELQQKWFSPKAKSNIVNSLNSGDHRNLAFFVCRNPLERLKSLYNYFLDMDKFKELRRRKPKNFKDFIRKSFTNGSYLSKF